MSFELVNFEKGLRGNKIEVKIYRDKKAFRIGRKLFEELNWGKKERVDLFFDKETGTFKMEKSKAGLITISDNEKYIGINSMNLCIEILYRAHNKFDYDGWAEDGVLYFRPKEKSSNNF